MDTQTPNTPRRPYPTDLSDARWKVIEPVLTAWRAARTERGVALAPPPTDLREIVNALFYLNRAGCAWRLLPHDFPPHSTVYYYFTAWRDEGVLERISNDLTRLGRKTAGRDPEPTAMIVDSQSVKTSTNVPESDQGTDPNKRIVGRKRHLGTDVLGFLLAVLVTAANTADTAGGKKVLDKVHAAFPTVSVAFVDAGYQAGAVEHAAALGINLHVVTRDDKATGFQPARFRWAVERTLGWLMTHRRLARDYEGRPDSSSAMIRIAMIDNTLRYITHESTPTWRDPPLLT